MPVTGRLGRHLRGGRRGERWAVDDGHSTANPVWLLGRMSRADGKRDFLSHRRARPRKLCVRQKLFGGRERGSGEKMQREGKEPFVGASKQRPDPGRSLNDDTLGPEALCARLQLWKLFGATDPGFRFLGTRNKDY